MVTTNYKTKRVRSFYATENAAPYVSNLEFFFILIPLKNLFPKS
jgi:hypothetical protein